MSKVCLPQEAFLDLLTLSSAFVSIPLAVLPIHFTLCIILQRAVQELMASHSLSFSLLN